MRAVVWLVSRIKDFGGGGEEGGGGLPQGRWLVCLGVWRGMKMCARRVRGGGGGCHRALCLFLFFYDNDVVCVAFVLRLDVEPPRDRSSNIYD